MVEHSRWHAEPVARWVVVGVNDIEVNNAISDATALGKDAATSACSVRKYPGRIAGHCAIDQGPAAHIDTGAKASTAWFATAECLRIAGD